MIHKLFAFMIIQDEVDVDDSALGSGIIATPWNWTRSIFDWMTFHPCTISHRDKIAQVRNRPGTPFNFQNDILWVKSLDLQFALQISHPPQTSICPMPSGTGSAFLKKIQEEWKDLSECKNG